MCVSPIILSGVLSICLSVYSCLSVCLLNYPVVRLCVVLFMRLTRSVVCLPVCLGFFFIVLHVTLQLIYLSGFLAVSIRWSVEPFNFCTVCFSVPWLFANHSVDPYLILFFDLSHSPSFFSLSFLAYLLVRLKFEKDIAFSNGI